MALDEVLNRCLSRWKRERIRLAPPIQEAELRRLWESLGRVVSEDVIRLYATVGGFENYDYDNQFLWSLWTEERIREENEERGSEGVIFCDHSLGVIHWVLRHEDQDHSSVWQITDNVQAAPSLEAFLRLYLADPWQLLKAWQPPDGNPRSRWRQ